MFVLTIKSFYQALFIINNSNLKAQIWICSATTSIGIGWRTTRTCRKYWSRTTRRAAWRTLWTSQRRTWLGSGAITTLSSSYGRRAVWPIPTIHKIEIHFKDHFSKHQFWMLRQRSRTTQESKCHSSALGTASRASAARKSLKFPATFTNCLRRILVVKSGWRRSRSTPTSTARPSENLAQFNWMCTRDNILNKFWAPVEINSLCPWWWTTAAAVLTWRSSARTRHCTSISTS